MPDMAYGVKIDGTQVLSYTYDNLCRTATRKLNLTAPYTTTYSFLKIGNPLTYRDGMTFTWQHGRELATYTKDGNTYTYSYDEDGYRVKKKTGSTETIYYRNGSTLLTQKTGNDRLDFFYDENDQILGFKDNGTKYYYTKNLQGDITGILDAAGNKVVEYTYDAWGKQLSCAGSKAETIGEKNPFRYRGYYYDAESGLYYLNSRYYDAVTGRFINADSLLTTTISPDMIYDKNLYSYCDNNPIMRIDNGGRLWFTVAGAFVGAIIGGASKVISNVSTGKNWSDGVIGAAVGGAVYGAVATSPILKTAAGAHVNAIASYASAAAESTVNEVGAYVTGKKKLSVTNVTKSIKKVVKDTAVEGTSTYLAGKVAGKVVKTNRGWFRPKKFVSSFIGKYARKTWKQSLVQGTITTLSNILRGRKR